MSEPSDVVYHRTQLGTVTIVSVGAAVLLVLVIAAQAGWNPVSIGVLVLLVLALALFWSLTIEIRPDRLRCFFGTGLIAREFPLHEIVSARAVRNRWYYGWGIRLTPHGWMFNVSGLDAVELGLVSGKRFRIGTDEPDEVVATLARLTSLRQDLAGDEDARRRG